MSIKSLFLHGTIWADKAEEKRVVIELPMYVSNRDTLLKAMRHYVEREASMYNTGPVIMTELNDMVMLVIKEKFDVL